MGDASGTILVIPRKWGWLLGQFWSPPWNGGCFKDSVGHPLKSGSLPGQFWGFSSKWGRSGLKFGDGPGAVLAPVIFTWGGFSARKPDPILNRFSEHEIQTNLRDLKSVLVYYLTPLQKQECVVLEHTVYLQRGGGPSIERSLVTIFLFFYFIIFFRFYWFFLC